MNETSVFKAAQAARATLVAAAALCAPAVGFAQSAPPAARPAVAARPKPAPQPQPQHSATVSAPATQGLAAERTAANDDVIARVGNTNVSAEEVRSYVAGLAPREQAAVTRDPAMLSQAVRMLLTNRLVLQEAQEKKWDQQPAVAAQLDRIREAAVVELYLQAVTAPPASFPSEEEVQKVYEANKAAMLMPRQFQLAQIFVPLPNGADKAAEDKAKQQVDEAVRQLKQPGADFASVASEVNPGKDSGDLGWVAEPQIRQEIRTQVIGLAKNTVSDPIKLDDGWHVLKLMDTKAAYTRTLPEVRDQLVQQMRTERAGLLRRTYLGELQKQHPPVLNELALSGLFDTSHKQ